MIRKYFPQQISGLWLILIIGLLLSSCSLVDSGKDTATPVAINTQSDPGQTTITSTDTSKPLSPHKQNPDQDTIETTATHQVEMPLSSPTQQDTIVTPRQPLEIDPLSRQLRVERESNPPYQQHLLPDSEVVYSPSSVGFDVNAYLNISGGYLARHLEYLRSTGWTSAGDIIQRVALENSINPKLLIALLEYTCACVRGNTQGQLDSGYVFGVENYLRKGLYGQLWWASNQLSSGYYGWRAGTLQEINLPAGSGASAEGGIIHRPSPELNAGSVALQYYFAQLMAAQSHSWLASQGMSTISNLADWQQALDPATGLPALYQEMFGELDYTQMIEPLLPDGLQQPQLILPFEPDVLWSFASGPHQAWESEGAQAALDFAPASAETGCIESKAWVVAVADGPIVRSGHGVVVQDLDGEISSDGHEQTGWSILYMHIATKERVVEGTYLHTGDRIGHPSCEGGPATGTHLHIARKYNGEWIAADGRLRFVMDGWVTYAGEQPYEGKLVKGEQVVVANPYGTRATYIMRTPESSEIKTPTPVQSGADWSRSIQALSGLLRNMNLW